MSIAVLPCKPGGRRLLRGRSMPGVDLVGHVPGSAAGAGPFPSDSLGVDAVITDRRMPPLCDDRPAGEMLSLRPDVCTIPCAGDDDANSAAGACGFHLIFSCFPRLPAISILMQLNSDFVIHVLSTDPEVTATLLALQVPLKMTVHASNSAAQTRREFPMQRPDVLVVDADVGVDAAVETIHHVRNRLFNDWLPIVLLNSDPMTREAVDRRTPWAVDFHLPKPLTVAALQERQAALRRMIAMRRISRSALDRVSEAVIVIDASGTIRSFNGAAEGLFGWTAQESIGANVSMLMPSGHREKHPEYLGNYRRTRHAKIIGVGRVETAVRKDGSQFPMHLTVADISDGSTVRFVGVIRDLSVYQQRDKLQNLIHHDSLTGLPNRAYATEVLAAAARDPDGPGYSVLFCDVDGFKRINDVHGHRIGDEVLKAIAQRLRKAVSDKDFVARLAGDEFLIVLHGVRDPQEACGIAHRVSESVSQPVRAGGLCVDCAVSIGAASTAPGRTPQAVIEMADQQMYEVKRARHAAALAH